MRNVADTTLGLLVTGSFSDIKFGLAAASISQILNAKRLIMPKENTIQIK